MEYYEKMMYKAAGNLSAMMREKGIDGKMPENEEEAKQALACILRHREDMSCKEMASALYEVMEFAAANLALKEKHHEDD